MTSSKRLWVVVIWLCVVTALAMSGSAAHSSPPAARSKAPKIWDTKRLATWAVPIAGVNATPNYYSEEEYYRAPVDNLRTYPVYHPDYEPKGYREWLKQQGARPMIQAEKLKTEKDWIEAGSRVFDELDLPESRSNDPRALAYVGDREALRRDAMKVTKDGIIPALRWVVDVDGGLKLSLSECSACHVRVMDDGSLIRGAQGNLNLGFQAVAIFFEAIGKVLKKQGKLLPPNESAYAAYGVPWVKDDIHLRFKTMSAEEAATVDGPPHPGTFSRFNGGPYHITKIPDLIGIRDRRYLDHTGTHLNRGPEDIARYAILVSRADDGSIGPYNFLTESQRRLTLRFSDEAMYALGKFIYSLEPPPNPNKFDALASEGQKVFEREGCAGCHTPPIYTNNKLTPALGFTPPTEHFKKFSILPFSVGTDSGLALRTRKGTGYYQVPSLRGLWYRGLIEHSGSIASLEDWFDPRRLRDDYAPSGWKGPDVRTHAVKGHEYGLNLSAADKRALIAFLKTL